MEIVPLDPDAGVDWTEPLSLVLVACVQNGASVSFMSGIDAAKARSFWAGVFELARGGERTVLAARDGERIFGTVQLIHRLPENQPHRAEVAKLLVDPAARRRGVGRALMTGLEAHASQLGKDLITLDTCRGSAAERLYRGLGYQEAGVIPGYALWPDGAPCDTIFFWKRLPAAGV